MPRGCKKKETPKIDDHVAFLTDLREYFEDTAVRMAKAKQIAERVQEITTDFLGQTMPVPPAEEEETDEDEDVPVKGKKPKKAAGGGDRPCGCAARGKHRKECGQRTGKLPPDKKPVQRSTSRQEVKCTDCDWKGEIGADADIMEGKCPKCRGSLVTE